MSHITVRDLPKPTEDRLRALARERGHSLNRTVVQTLTATLVGGAAGPAKKRDLSDLAGTWSAAEAAAFERRLRVFEETEPELWK